MTSNKPFSEIIESSLYSWLSQSWDWNVFPQFGSLMGVDVGNRILFGLVHQIQTGSMDPMRYPFPYQKTHDELLKEQPQIFEFLKTTFSCLTMGYLEKGKIYYMLPPEPPLIHSFVYVLPAELKKQFFYRTHYLHLLFSLSSHTQNIDELLLALLKQQTELQLLSTEKLQQFTHAFSLLTGNDYRRLKLFLQRVEHIV
jgi:hypothetical protein